ncbi:MAG: hypothetical protein ACI9TV_000095 [Sulfurimonas sp.]|jgi:hypothetical protein|uniref:hypothetical protein n=1 Tax=Sulfurimonas sp. TaxID=2022749 RepID=UPI0039E5CAB3
MEARLVNAPISLVFSQADLNAEVFEREYHQLSESEDNAINQWLKLAKARGETSDSDPVLLNLIVELHNKIDALEQFLRDEEPVRISLTVEAHIDSIGFEHFNLSDSLLEVGVQYYGRIEMPVHPKRDVGVFFKAESETLAKITRIHDRDEKEWGAYMTARERVLIREAREKK